MRKFFKRKTALFLSLFAVVSILSSFPSSLAGNEYFFDIPEGAEYESDLNYLCDAGIINGIGNGKFAPDRLLTRAEAAQILWQMIGRTSPEKRGHFADVPDGIWYSRMLDSMYDRGIFHGVETYQNGEKKLLAKPNEPIKRGELFKLIYNFLSVRDNQYDVKGEADVLIPFKDSESIPGWNLDSVISLVSCNLITGEFDKNTNDKPLKLNLYDYITRSQSLKYFYVVRSESLMDKSFSHYHDYSIFEGTSYKRYDEWRSYLNYKCRFCNEKISRAYLTIR